MTIIAVGRKLRKKEIKEVVRLSNGWFVIKTENGKSPEDFKVRTIFTTTPRIRSITPKHAHFAVDFYGKLCANRGKAMKVFEAIIQVWKGRSVSETLNEYSGFVRGLPGYDLEYILQALNWIFEQEDINFTGRPVRKQQELDKTLRESNVILPPEKFGGLSSKRLGSQLAVSLFCDLTMGIHPVDALRKVSLDIVPAKRSRGAV